MTVEHASMQVVGKPWGSTDLRPWSAIHDEGVAIGELWFQRTDIRAPEPALLLKLLFTKEALSIQVHPDDAFARSIGLPHGKTEAWYVLAATRGAKVAVGLKRKITTPELRASIQNGSVVDLVEWRPVVKDDVIFVPAGSIHAIGPGLVIAEIQQRSDATFRLFDYGRERELHVDNAAAAAHPEPAECQAVPRHLTGARTVLVTSPYFVLERIDLAPGSRWDFHAGCETWFLVLEGDARVGPLNTLAGDVIFLEAESAAIKVGADGLKGLAAYAAAEPNPRLLRVRCPFDGFAQLPLHHQSAIAELPVRAREANS